MSQKKFDSIISCGDSFTEGHRNVLGIDISQTWTAQVASNWGVPYENLGDAGASNLDIALQPVRHQTLKTKNPLYLFNFTIDERMPIISHHLGSDFTSLFSILPEDIAHIPFSSNYRDLINHFLITLDKNGVDGFQSMTSRAIDIVHNITNINPNAHVLWGFMHADNKGEEHTIFDRGGNDTDNSINIQFTHTETCYNRHVDYKPIEYFINDDQYKIGPHDGHPNKLGIKVFADIMTGIIKNEF